MFNPLKVYAPIALGIFCFSFIFSLYGVVVYQSFPKTGIVGILVSFFLLFMGIVSDQIAILARKR